MKSCQNYRLPAWFKQEIPGEGALSRVRKLSSFNINTVCKEAKCPNLSHCFENGKLTFMILGSVCTRNCRFCGVKKKSGTVLKPKQNCPQSGDSLRLSQEPSLGIDSDEPKRLALAVKEFGINYAVITSVTRDDLDDGGAGQFAETIELIREAVPGIKVEALIPDFRGEVSSLRSVLSACPTVVAHNMETVSRLYAQLRPEASYWLSLDILGKIKELAPGINTKSSLMLGLGETEPEVIATMEDLRYNNCDVLTLGQYLAPSPGHYPVKEFISIEQFQDYKRIGLSLGFKAVLSGPLVRSSYHAEEAYKEFMYV